MSGTDYTQTPNYGLYKPLPNADNDAWGAHWNDNADTLDSALHAVTGGAAGPFLPLAGGTVSGNITMPSPNALLSVWGVGSQIQARNFWALIDNTITFSGTQAHTDYGFLFSGNLAGSAAPGASANYIGVATDTATLPAGAQGISWFAVNGNVGGGSPVSGNRAAISSELTFIGPCTGAPSDRQWQANLATFQSAHSAGGTAPTGSLARGFGYAGGDQAWLQTGATNWAGILGREIDVMIQAGASAASRLGLHIVGFDVGHGTDYDQAVTVSAGPAGFMHAYGLGTNAIDATNGTVLGYKCIAGTGAEPPPKGFRGIDLSPYLFSNAAFRSAGGFVVDGLGAVNVNSIKLNATNAGQAQLDVPGQSVTAVAINNGGTGYVAGDQLFGPYGTIVTVSAVSGGVITGIAVNVYGGTTLASPSMTAVPFVGGSGTGNATFNLTFTAVGGSLSLNPTGKQVLTNLSAAATDAAAATAGVPLDGLYNNAGVVHVRLT